ncbi:MAG: translation elongation factor Ts [Patescibacteria group bacterium]
MSLDLIKEIRNETSLPINDIKKAIEAVGENKDAIIKHLREQGALKSSKRSDRITDNGSIFSYIHDGRIGVLLELQCETDFVARGDDFKSLGQNLCLQIAASQPKFLNSNQVDQSTIDAEMEIQRKLLESENKPAEIIEKILNGKKDKFFEEIVLLEQPYVKDPSLKVKDLVNVVSQKTGEKINVSRFTLYILGKQD